MNRELQIILVKFVLIVVGIIIYISVMMFYVAPIVLEQAYGQSAFDNTNPYGQPQYDQFNQYQQPYQNQFQQYGTQTYSPYGMQPTPAPYPSNTVLGFGIQEIVTALIAGGGATAYARRRTNSL